MRFDIWYQSVCEPWDRLMCSTVKIRRRGLSGLMCWLQLTTSPFFKTGKCAYGFIEGDTLSWYRDKISRYEFSSWDDLKFRLLNWLSTFVMQEKKQLEQPNFMDSLKEMSKLLNRFEQRWKEKEDTKKSQEEKTFASDDAKQVESGDRGDDVIIYSNQLIQYVKSYILILDYPVMVQEKDDPETETLLFEEFNSLKTELLSGACQVFEKILKRRKKVIKKKKRLKRLCLDTEDQLAEILNHKESGNSDMLGIQMKNTTNGQKKSFNPISYVCIYPFFLWIYEAKIEVKLQLPKAITRSKTCVHMVNKGSRKVTQKVEEQIRRFTESLRGYIDTHRSFVRVLNEWQNRNIMEKDDQTEAPEIYRVCSEWLREIENVAGFKVLGTVMELRFKSLGFKQIEKKIQRLRTKKLCKEQNVKKLKPANVELTSQSRMIEDLKHKLRERDKDLGAMTSSSQFGERELDRMCITKTIKRKKDFVAVYGFGTKSQLLTQANEIVKRQEDEINTRQRALIKEEEEEIEISIVSKGLEQKRLREIDAHLKRQMEDWLITLDEVSKLQEEFEWEHFEKKSEDLRKEAVY